MPGLHVRTGTAQGLYYIEAVFGEDVSFNDTMPMAVLIHGRGDRARIPGGPFWGLGAPLRVIVPQAPDPLGTGTSGCRCASGRTWSTASPPR